MWYKLAKIILTSLRQDNTTSLTQILVVSGSVFCVQFSDGNRSGRPAGRVTVRVEILRPAGQPVETPVKFSFFATRKHLSTNPNVHINYISNKTFYKKNSINKLHRLKTPVE